MSPRPAHLLLASLITGLRLAAGEPAIVPQPMRMETHSGSFDLTAGTSIAFNGGKQEADKLAATLRTATGFELPVAAFVEIGDMIEIDTRTNEFKRRAN